MKMGSVGVAMAVVVMVVTSVSMRGAEAQSAVSCLTVAGAGAPFNDAAALVQELRVKPGQCCQSGSGFCSVVLTSGNAAATVCGTFSTCPSCADVGNNLNLVLAQCNVLNEVQGAYSPDGTSQQLFYLTSASTHP